MSFPIGAAHGEKMSTLIFLADAFTEVPFTGNPAGVCLLQGKMKPEKMQQVAAELNVSETAFVIKENTHYQLRWFTPQTEVTLCGHATLATSHVLWEAGWQKPTQSIEFHTESGVLRTQKKGNWIEMDFPARVVQDAEKNGCLEEALDIRPIYTGRFPTPRGDVYLLEVKTEDAVRALAPDFLLLTKSGARAVIVTSRSKENRYDFISRYFAPAVGINEDPVTGSSHCCLAPYWERKLGKTELIGYQASKRGGVVGCMVQGERVVLRGKAVTILKAELIV